jgi:hypothetical protein
MPYIKPTLVPGQFALYAINRMLNTQYTPRNVVNGLDYNNPDAVQQFINAYIPIAFYDGKFSSKFSTYDENLQIKDNSQYSLSFSIAKYIDNELNPIFYLITENRRLRLQTYDRKIDFIITGITPNITKNNVVYSVTCQDTFSYDLSKQNTSISYETTAPLNIRDLATSLLSAAQLTSRWEVDPDLENQYYADFPSYQKLTEGSTDTTHRMLASLTISNSTPYNALIELCKKFNASLEVEYSDTEGTAGILYFRNKITSSFQGYHLRDSVNLSAFSVSRKTDNFCSIMHISGGEDASGQLVSISPTMPQDVQQYFMMLNPIHVESESERISIFNTISYPYAVAESNGVYTLYKRYSNSSIYVTAQTNYTPWIKLSTEDIEKDFNSFGTKEDGKPFFSSANSLEIIEYFNFLKYRCKSAASLFYDFEYYLSAGLMDDATYQRLEDLFSIDLRNANIILYCINYQYNLLSAQLARFEDKEEEFIAELCALEEEMYTYATNPDMKPETVLAVSGTEEESALSRTTVEAANEEERMKVLSQLMTTVWTDEYFRLMLTLKGHTALTQRKADYEAKLLKKENEFSSNLQTANTILNTSASTGTISASSYSIPTDTEKYTIESGNIPTPTKIQVDDPANPGSKKEVDSYVSGSANVGYVYNKSEGSYTLVFNMSGEITTTGTYAFAYANAVLDTSPTVTDMAWPFGEYATFKNAAALKTVTNLDGTYAEVEASIYIRTSTSDTSCKCYSFKPIIATTRLQREMYLSESNQTDYVNYSVAKKKFQDALTYITETPSKYDEVASTSDEPMRRGLYSMTLYYINELLSKADYGYLPAYQKYKTPANLLESLTSARATQRSLWANIYKDYSDYIIETNFTDSDQLSSEGLFMAAMEAFSKYKTPTYEYSTTVIDTKAIADIQSREIKINDIVYVYNKDISSEYTGRIKVTIPNRRIGQFYTISGLTGDSVKYLSQNETANATISAVSSVNPYGLGVISNPCRLYCRNQGYVHTFAYDDDDNPATIILSSLNRNSAKTLNVSEVRANGNLVDVYLHCPNLGDAIAIISNKSGIDTFEFFTTAEGDVPVYTNVLDIQLEERAKPIPLQVTGITQKLREATSQLTVSTDRTMDLVFQRLIQQARL